MTTFTTYQPKQKTQGGYTSSGLVMSLNGLSWYLDNIIKRIESQSEMSGIFLFGTYTKQHIGSYLTSWINNVSVVYNY